MAAGILGKDAAKKQHSTKTKSKAARVRDKAERRGSTGDLRHQLQMSQAVFARLLSISVRSLATLESGSPPTEVVARRMTELKRLANALAEVMKSETIGTWLQAPNEAFDGLKPLEVIERGEGDRIWSMVYFLRSGVPS